MSFRHASSILNISIILFWFLGPTGLKPGVHQNSLAFMALAAAMEAGTATMS